MSLPIYNSATNSYLSLKTAVKRGFPSDTLIPRPGYKAYAIKDARTKSGYRWEVTRSAFEVSKLSKNKKAKSLADLSKKKSYTYPIKWNDSVLTQIKSIIEDKDISPFWFQPYEIIKELDLINQQIDFQVIDSTGKVYRSKNIKLNFPSYSALFNMTIMFIFNNSGGILPEWKDTFIEGATTVRIIVYSPVTASSIKQSFADGDVHCILGPVLFAYEEMLETQKSKNSKRAQNITGHINKCKKLMAKYKDGIPEDKMMEVAKAVEACFQIEDIMGNVLNKHNQYSKGRIFRFINSRINHCDHYVDLDAPPIEITADRARELIHQSIAERIPAPYTGTMTEPRMIRMPGQTYIVGTPINKALNDFTKTFDKGMFIDSMREPELAEYCIEATHMTINWTISTETPINEIDMKAAYTQFKKYRNYMGFPAIINNVRICTKDHDVRLNPGIYTVKIHSIPMEEDETNHEEEKYGLLNKRILLKKMGFSCREYVLTSPWIQRLRWCGCNLTVLKGAWGKRMDFDFSDDMKAAKAYAVWSGMQMNTDKTSTWRYPCDETFASIIMDQVKNVDSVKHNPITQTVLINKTKDHHRILPHIAAFIVSYCQLNVFDEMCRYDAEYVVGTKLDSIMLTCDLKPYDKELWCDVRDDEDFVEIKQSKYASKVIFKPASKTLDFDEPLSIESFLTKKYLPPGDLFISGQGGCGKTHLVCKKFRKGFRNPHFTTIAWKLVSEVVNKYDIRGTSINQLTGKGFGNQSIPTIKERYGQPGVIICDELSMWSKSTVEKIQELYPYSQLILLGDYHEGQYYQTSISTGGDLYHPGIYHRMTSDFRSHDDETKQFKLQCRQLMDEHNHFGLLAKLYNTFQRITPDELKAEYNMDYVLTGTHKRCDYFTELLKGEQNHYLVTDHSFTDILRKQRDPTSVHLHGEIVDEDIGSKCKLRHGFTVHAFQGSEIEESKKCYIDIQGLNTMQDIYTAVSRVHRISQIKLVTLTTDMMDNA